MARRVGARRRGGALRRLDQMPPTVGVGTFWTGMASWLGGARLSSVADAIDESWPLIQPRIVIDDRTDTADAEVPGG
ncbi:MAG: hypothetical protein R2713_15340 [Ilumatobacteraceae bacterium]